MKNHKTIYQFIIAALVVLSVAACSPPVSATEQPADAGMPTTLAQPTGQDANATLPVPVSATATAPQAMPTSVGTELPATGASAPEGWLEVNNRSLGYSLYYPPEWEVCQETKYSLVLCEIQPEPTGMGPPPRLYVSVFPQASTNADFEVYNFYPMDKIRAYMALPVGETLLKEEIGPLTEYLRYTRLPDRQVAGMTGAVIENSKVWEMPAETKDRVVFLTNDDQVFIIGMYYDTPELLATFDQVLDTFQINQ